MNAAFIVLAECIDIRSGKRFSKGDEFAPVPDIDQAERLVSAGCLPEEAIEAVADSEREAREKAEAEQRAKADAEAKAKAKADADAAKKAQ